MWAVLGTNRGHMMGAGDDKTSNKLMK